MTTTADVPRTAEDLAGTYLELMKRVLMRCADGEVFLAAPPDGAVSRAPSMEEMENGVAMHPDADTMIGRPRLDNVQACIESVLRDGVPGDFVETGVWRGGTCVFMRAVLKAYGVQDRRVWLADSFAGFPPPDSRTYPMDAVYERYASFAKGLGESIAVSADEVRARFRGYGLLDDNVRFLEGFFSDTLPHAPIDDIAVLRLDGDYYQSTWEALEYLYPRLSPGGYCIVDDYWLTTCRKAVDDFRKKHGITESVEIIDWTGVYWRKGR
ncbi:TylF/MycF/NovP-related O-methyltransferase [Streptomyces sp. NPDC050287]|uniref:TylF/MycF/NovP-related O-methyltransferase n=1 Tax=Streptomyces sp. NPDC050287 TaxID=3365608 RepID=UPI0037AAC555